MVQLTERSKQLRRDIIKLSKANGAYHLGGSFSCVEILIALYDFLLKTEDRFILSKGHACYTLYTILRERGFDPKLASHPDIDVFNGIDWSTGSMGHGFPAGVGMAFARKQMNKSGHVYVLIGDGESQEGTTWESLLIAARYKLDNLTVIVDNNKIQGSDFVDNVLPVVPMLGIAAKTAGWTIDEVDGHDIAQLVMSIGFKASAPSLIVANTVKGCGVSFMENKPAWHACWLSDPNEEIAMRELQ